jgi:hypothetical protein
VSTAALTLDRGGCQVTAPELYYDFNWPAGYMPATLRYGGAVPRRGEVVPVGDCEGNRCLATVTRVELRPGKPIAIWVDLDMETWEPA